MKETLEKVLSHISEAIKILENNVDKSPLQSYAITGLRTARYAVSKILGNK